MCTLSDASYHSQIYFMKLTTLYSNFAAAFFVTRKWFFNLVRLRLLAMALKSRNFSRDQCSLLYIFSVLLPVISYYFHFSWEGGCGMKKLYSFLIGIIAICILCGRPSHWKSDRNQFWVTKLVIYNWEVTLVRIIDRIYKTHPSSILNLLILFQIYVHED